MTQLTEVSGWRDETALLSVPAAAGIFRIGFAEGLPYLGKTANLRRRLRRLLQPRDRASVRLTLREIARDVRYGRTGSRFESDLLLYRMARTDRPEDCRDYLKLRAASFVKVLLRNRFPRTCLTQRLTRGKALFFGPFPSRRTAEQFQSAFLDLFRVRRCTENLTPSPDHPGCIWGEMDLCLRPCQAACNNDEYAAEADRLARFLLTDGDSLIEEITEARDLASAAMEFEAAARHHGLLAKAKAALRLRSDLSRELGGHHGLMLQESSSPRCLSATPLYKGSLQASFPLPWGADSPSGAGFAAALRTAFDEATWTESPLREREDHLALLQRWHGSSFRRGEFVPIPDPASPPFRKLANAAMRVALGRDRRATGDAQTRPAKPDGKGPVAAD